MTRWWVSPGEDAGEGRNETNKKGIIPFETMYPKREGFVRQLTRRDPLLHVGYMTDRMTPCRCGAHPVLEQYVEDVNENNERHVPAHVFVAICPVCELKAEKHGTLDECINEWNAKRFSPDSVMVRKKLTDPSIEGCEALSNRVLADAVSEAVTFVKRKHELMEKLHGPIDDDTREIHYTELQRVRGNLRKIADFIHKSPLVFSHDEEAVLSGIRRNVYPGLTPEERLTIPLNLLRM